MIDIKKQLVAELNSILPTSYELIVQPTDKLPIITYVESGDYVSDTSKLLEYNKKQFIIKLWADKVSEVGQYTETITDKLRAIGLKLTNYNELAFGKQICAIMTFNCMTYNYLE